MSRALRITLMWLLTLAVPVHGFAAASMLGCMGSQHRVAALAGTHSHASSHHADGAVMHPHSHDASASHADAHKGHADGKATCSACAACCASAALPATPVVFEQPTLAPDSFVLPAPQHVGRFISGGLERPPRSVLA